MVGIEHVEHVEPGEETAAVTLLGRMTGSGISEERARAHIGRGVVRIAGRPVTDPDLPLPWPSSWVVGPE